MRRQRLAYVKQEHGVFSAHVSNYLKARSGNTSAIASSLVLGDYFIHCYNFSIQDENSFVEIRTYSRYTNTCHTEGYSMIDMMVIVKEIRNHLEVSCSSWFIYLPIIPTLKHHLEGRKYSLSRPLPKVSIITGIQDIQYIKQMSCQFLISLCMLLNLSQ